MTIRQISAVDSDVVTVSELKARLRLTGSDDDAMLSALIAAAREFVEGQTGRVLVQRSFRVVCVSWEAPLSLVGASPLTSVESVKYWPADGGAQIELTGWKAITTTEPSFIVWPTELPALYDRPDAVTIELTAGGECPETLKQAVWLLAAHFYEQPSPVNVGNIVNEIPFSLRAMIESNRLAGFIS